MTAAKSAAGGVRVCARFRPQNKLELKQQAVEVVRLEDDTTVRIGGSNGSFDAAHTFTFDQVFGTSSTQAEVYAATAKPLVQAALQGYNCTCFVYGQTGTGKTFSMEGVPGDKEYAGIIPRVMDDIFDGIENMQAELEFIVRVSYIEIYLEKIRDLLEPSSNNLSVRESRERGVWVAGATEVCCASSDEMMAVMRLGGANRVISSTRMNNDSSRSHSVFIITIEQRNVTTGSTKSGKLFLVDLAGSEKVGKTHAKGQTLKEAQHINKSLSALGSVMNALTSGQANAHIPYRDSKLTRLLQDSLGGNSETTLLVCGSCSSYNAEETLTTLRFGQRAKSIKNKPKVNEERTVAEYKQLLAEKEQVIASLQAQLQAVAHSTQDSGALPSQDSSNEEHAKKVQDLVAKLEQLDDELLSKSTEIASLEERVVELEGKEKEWRDKELQFTKLNQQSEELTSKLSYVESELAAKSEECDKLQELLGVAKQQQEETDTRPVLPHGRPYSYSDADAARNALEAMRKNGSSGVGGSIETELLRQQLSTKTTELELCTKRMHSLAEELDNCHGFYERQIAMFQEKIREYDSYIKGFMELGDSEDKSAQLESLAQKTKTLRSVRGGGGTSYGHSVHATQTKQLRDALAAASGTKKHNGNAEPEQYHRPRFVSSASTVPDGWVLDEEVFPMAPIDMDSPVVQRLIASMPEKGREKMYKWLVFVLEGRDIRANFHPEISMEGINDEISRDMRRLIIPLLKKRQDIDVESFVRTRFVKVSDLKIKLVHRHRDTMHLESTAADEDQEDTDTASEAGARRASTAPRGLGKMWAKEHLFYGPKSDPASESVLHTQRVLATSGRLDRFVSEPVDMSASIQESKNILSSAGGVTLAKESADNATSSAPTSSKDGTGLGLGGMLNRFRARQASVSHVLGDVKSALTARYHKHHVHEDTMCDGCGMSPIVGAKWKCNTCEDYELCDGCYSSGIHGCDVSLEMCRRIEQVAVQKHRSLAQYPELFELLRAHICGDDVVHFRQIVEWLCDIVSGKPVAQLNQRSIVKSGLHPEVRARLVGQLGALASERTDLEMKTEWFVEAEEDEEGDPSEGESDSASTHSQNGTKEASMTPPISEGVELETLRMYVVDVAATSEAATSGPGSSRKPSYGDRNVASVTSECSSGSVASEGATSKVV